MSQVSQVCHTLCHRLETLTGQGLSQVSQVSQVVFAFLYTSMSPVRNTEPTSTLSKKGCDRCDRRPQSLTAQGLKGVTCRVKKGVTEGVTGVTGLMWTEVFPWSPTEPTQGTQGTRSP